PIVYFLVEVLPNLGRSRSARRAMKAMRNTIDPGYDLRQAEGGVRLSGNVQSRLRLAEEQVAEGQIDAAIATYRSAMTGLYEHDPALMLGLAHAQFAAEDYRGARETLDALIGNNPDCKSPDGHLLYARSLEGEGNFEKALDEYRALSKYYPGAEATVRYAQLLKQVGQLSLARTVLHELMEYAQLAPSHYRKAQREWLELARREL
ncbi:MAG: tetratricopeptide repeat protein, partial [Steroidobacteraceae bacterium]